MTAPGAHSFERLASFENLHEAARKAQKVGRPTAWKLQPTAAHHPPRP